jgi:diguanylate cyclase (GGDEF)-like protein
MSFIKDLIPEVKKDLAKDAIKYVAAGIGGIILIWTAKELKFLDDFLGSDLVTTRYSIIVYCFIAIVVSSLVTFILFNLKYQKLKRDSLRDELTGLFNEKAFQIKLKESVAWAKNERKKLSLILIDIDNFKKLNDTFTMYDGDLVMKQLGDFFNSDSRVTDITCRQHNKGDEFIIITKETDGSQARMGAERKRNAIKDLQFQIQNSQLVSITVSCGIAEFIIDKDT